CLGGDATPCWRQGIMLKLRKIGIDSYRENVAYLSRDCSIYRPEEFQALNKIEIGKNGRKILATLNIVDDARILASTEIGLSEQAFNILGLPEGEAVEVFPAKPPESLEWVRAKIGGRTLSAPEFDQIIEDI